MAYIREARELLAAELTIDRGRKSGIRMTDLTDERPREPSIKEALGHFRQDYLAERSESTCAKYERAVGLIEFYGFVYPS